MLSTLRRNRRTRRQARFSLESLDDRLVLSTGASGAAVEVVGARAAAIEHRREVRFERHEARLARREARHEARLARIEARHAAREQMLLARAATSAMAMSPVNATVINASGSAMGTSSGSGSAMGSVSGNGTFIAPGAPPSGNGTIDPGANVPGPPGSGTTTPPVTTTPPAPTTPPVTTPPTGTGTGSSNSPGTLPANVAAALQSLYQEFENAGGDSFTPSLPSDNLLQISGTSVMVNLKMASGTDFNTFLSQLQSDGLSVSSSSAAYGLVDGMLPIANLPAVAQVAASVTAVSPPRNS